MKENAAHSVLCVTRWQRAKWILWARHFIQHNFLRNVKINSPTPLLNRIFLRAGTFPRFISNAHLTIRRIPIGTRRGWRIMRRRRRRRRGRCFGEGDALGQWRRRGRLPVPVGHGNEWASRLVVACNGRKIC